MTATWTNERPASPEGSTLVNLGSRRGLAADLYRYVAPIALAGALTIVPNTTTTTISLDDLRHVGIYRADSSTIGRARRHIAELGWTREQAIAMRQRLAAFAEDWDDPAMDVYDAV